VRSLGWIAFRPGEIVPVVVRGLIVADVAFWMRPAAVTNGLSHDSPPSIILPGVLSATSVVGLVAALAFRLSRGNVAAGRAVARALSIVGLLAILAITGYAAAIGSADTRSRAGALVIAGTTARFSTH